MSGAQLDPHDKMRGRDMSKVATGQQATRPAHHIHDNPPHPHHNNTTHTEENESWDELKTAPADPRFPSTNQTRHCLEFHKCIKEKGKKDAPECQKFAKYYRSLCPAEWIEEWEEQREHGTFPSQI